ncbi:hypothetical protein AAX05_03505 [Moraxella bovoculi]|uniref:hypothetical protein n=1 Tax=Moraxella bovoculi TaxID=386891 RepID=UPI00062468A3|nr:hypothetical protein [Moraxella bovoculi]AKG09395.1 hypothetical protein AAX05_03505 [Moraxella bovoculi]AKG13220.1 hypothetical protein AAX11_03250 [Moraxella bovoculi]
MDFDLFASEVEQIECPYCQEIFCLDDIECIDEQIKAENTINDREGVLVCGNDNCKKSFYFKGFVEYRYASKKL